MRLPIVPPWGDYKQHVFPLDISTQKHVYRVIIEEGQYVVVLGISGNWPTTQTTPINHTFKEIRPWAR